MAEKKINEKRSAKAKAKAKAREEKKASKKTKVKKEGVMVSPSKLVSVRELKNGVKKSKASKV